MEQPKRESFDKLKDVMKRTKMGRSTIYKAVKEGTFPAPVKLGPRASAWTSSSIDAWIEERIQQSAAA